MFSINISRAREVIGASQGKTIAVIGDIMLDRYFWGSVSRVSPEAPVPVIDFESETNHLGGAANVANNLHSLGLNPIMCGVIGVDRFGDTALGLLKESGLSVDCVVEDKSRPTTVKTRIIGNNQQIARLDSESRELINAEIEESLINKIKSVKDLSGIIFEDYNKGLVTATLIENIIEYANENDIPVFVDPKFDNFFSYKKVTVFKPNKKEAQTALGMTIKSEEDVDKAGQALIEKLDCECVLLTLGEKGAAIYEKSGDITKIPTKARHIADVSGAGDTVIATFAASIIGGANFKESAIIANFAAGIVCEEPGIVSIEAKRIFSAIEEA